MLNTTELECLSLRNVVHGIVACDGRVATGAAT
jgi:hypothetical protein